MQNDQDDHSHNAHSSTDGTNPSECSDWTFNSVFGIIHAKNCSVCRSYIMHLADANHSGDTSFKTALHHRESRISEAFMDGVHNGRQLQEEDDVSIVLRYREERDKALENFEQQKKQLDAAREEIQRLQSRALSQVALDNTVAEGNNEAKSPAQSRGDALSLACSPLFTPAVDLDDVDSDVGILSPLSSTNYALPMIPDVPTSTKSVDLRQAAFLEAGKASIDSAASSQSSPASELVDSLQGTHSYAEIASQPNTFPPATSKPATTPLTPSKATLPNLSTPTSTIAHGALNAFHPTSIVQFKTFMSAAHAGDDSALEIIKSFCSVMHKVPVNQRTELQQYVAQHWRKPARVSSASKQRSFSTDIFVDATAWGIGFVMNGVWTAWKFSTRAGNGFDMGRAQMLAVEVGLRTVVHWVNLMIHTEGENFPLFITVQTDNWSTKRAIEKRQSNKPRRQEVLQRILDMLSEFNIQLTLKGIDPAQNLASNPARGAPGLGATQLPFKPDIPSYLTDILNAIPTNN